MCPVSQMPNVLPPWLSSGSVALGHKQAFMGAAVLPERPWTPLPRPARRSCARGSRAGPVPVFGQIGRCESLARLRAGQQREEARNGSALPSEGEIVDLSKLWEAGN